MKEVSCRVFDALFRALRRKGVSFSALVDGTGVSLEKLRNKHERIDWSEYLAIMANARGLFSDSEYVEMGGAFFRSPMIRPIAVVARLLFSAHDFYRWVANPARGAGKQSFTCIRGDLKQLGPTHLNIDVTLADGYEVCRDFFLITQGALTELPRILGLPAAAVTLTELPRGARYDIRLPQEGGLIARIRRALLYPFAARQAARELKEAHETLQQRYEELEEARTRLDRQATQLRTAHTISNVIRRDLDLARTMEAVAAALVEVGGFKGAEVALSVELEGRRFSERASAGALAGVAAIRRPIVIRQGEAGEVALWLQDASAIDEKRELLEYVVPAVSIALADAMAFTALADYRSNLEKKVGERTAELRAAQEARDRIFANVNHEIRTPLSLILLSADDLKRRAGEAADARTRRSLSGIESSARRLLNLVDDLLLLAAGAEDKVTLRLVRLDAALVLQRLIGAWIPAAENAGLTITLEAHGPCLCRADEAALERMVTNLVSNAVKFTPSPGRIEVVLQAGEEELLISVKDTGIGIDPEFRSRIFQRFEQGRRPVRPGAYGSGLGLAIVKELAERHQGSLSVTDNPGGGSSFTIRLPRSLEAPPDAEAAPSDVPANPPAGLLPSSPDLGVTIHVEGSPEHTVLVAEDDPDLRRAIADGLKDRYRVIAAPDGASALLVAGQERPDILVSDVAMPGIDGLELTRRFRALPGNRLAPVLLLTAYGSLRDRLAGFESGAVDYIVKPFEHAELDARIRSQLMLRDVALRLHESEKLASLGVLSAGLAHEIRNPANAVVNAVEPLKRLLPKEVLEADTPTGQLLGLIEDGAAQIARLSRQLLGYTRNGAVAHQLESFPRILNRALVSVASSTERVAIKKDIGYAGLVPCAAPLIVQVFTNLLENAAHAAGPGGWIKISTKIEDGKLVCDFEDSGPGVPPALRERIFEPFFTTKPPGIGTGLGLTTSRQIVEQHGGSLHLVHGTRGAIFRVVLPAEGAKAAEQRRSA